MSNVFTKLNLQGVKSSKGYIVQFTERNEMRYEEGDHILSIFVEGGSGNNKESLELIYASLIKAWLAPYEKEDIRKERKEEIIHNIKDALDFLGISYSIR